MANPGSQRIVVIGGGYAGLTAAARIAENLPDGQTKLIDAKTEFVERIRLHEIAAGTRPQRLPYDEFMATRGGRFIQARVVRIDTDDKRIHLETPAGDQESVEYDTLVYALGSCTDRDAVPGVRKFAAFLDTAPECEALAERLGQLESRDGTVLIAGGGLTAIEAACEFAERLPGLRVILAPGRSFSPDQGPGGLSRAGFQHVVGTLQRLDVEIIDGARITELLPDRALLENGDGIAFDACIWGAGFVVPPLAADAGIDVTGSGRIVTDRTLASASHPDILAVGDAAYVVTDQAGECRMSCAAGRPMGDLAAQTAVSRAAGKNPAPFEFQYSFRCISLGRDDGLIQFVDAWDHPVEEVWTGARGARWKEYICRRTLAGVGFTSDLGPPPDTPPQIS